MSSRHARTLQDVFAQPTKANIEWTDIERMLTYYGVHLEQREGSRIAARLGPVYAVFHRPHPRKEAPRYLVCDVREFCRAAGLQPGSRGQ
jgi:hypothetical protein